MQKISLFSSLSKASKWRELHGDAIRTLPSISCEDHPHHHYRGTAPLPDDVNVFFQCRDQDEELFRAKGVLRKNLALRLSKISGKNGYKIGQEFLAQRKADREGYTYEPPIEYDTGDDEAKTPRTWSFFSFFSKTKEIEADREDTPDPDLLDYKGISYKIGEPNRDLTELLQAEAIIRRRALKKFQTLFNGEASTLWKEYLELRNTHSELSISNGSIAQTQGGTKYIDLKQAEVLCELKVRDVKMPLEYGDILYVPQHCSIGIDTGLFLATFWDGKGEAVLNSFATKILSEISPVICEQVVIASLDFLRQNTHKLAGAYGVSSWKERKIKMQECIEKQKDHNHSLYKFASEAVLYLGKECLFCESQVGNGWLEQIIHYGMEMNLQDAQTIFQCSRDDSCQVFLTLHGPHKQSFGRVMIWNPTMAPFRVVGSNGRWVEYFCKLEKLGNAAV